MPIQPTQIENLFTQIISMIPQAGKLTSEYSQARKTGWVAVLILLLSVACAVLNMATSAFGTNSHLGYGLFIALAGLSAALHGLTTVVYTNSRVDVKKSIPAICDSIGGLLSVVSAVSKGNATQAGLPINNGLAAFQPVTGGLAEQPAPLLGPAK